MSLKDTVRALAGTSKPSAESAAADPEDHTEEADPENLPGEPEDNGPQASAGTPADASAIRTAERTRIKSILEAGAHAPDQAAHLAFETDMDASAAAGILATAPKVSADSGLSARMQRVPNPDLGTGAAKPSGQGDHNDRLVEHAKARQAKRKPSVAA